MSDAIQRLVVSLEARTRDFERALTRIERQNRTAFSRIERDANRSLKGLESAMARTSARMSGWLKGTAAGIAAGVSVQGAKELIDAATRIRNALKISGLEGDKLTKVYDRLFASAQKNAAPLEALAGLYGRVSLVQKELNASSEEMLRFTDNVALALRVSGRSAAESSGALLQLSQALGSGTVRAEEFNSILEGALPIAQAAAAGMREAGGSVAKLRQLVVDGKVSSEAFFRAFEVGAATLEEKVASAELTTSQHFIRLQNVLIDTAGKLDAVTGASAFVGKALSGLTDIVAAVGEVAQKVADGGLGQFVGVLGEAITLLRQIEPLSRSLDVITGDNIRKLGDLIGGDGSSPLTGNDAVRSRIAELQRQQADLTGATAPMERRLLQATIDSLEAQLDEAYGRGGPSGRGGRRRGKSAAPAAKEPISIKDFPVSGDSGGGGSSSGGRRRGSTSPSERADEYARLAKNIADATAATVAETEAQRGLNPLVEDFGFAAEKARIEQELLTAAHEAGKQITPQLREEIAALADQYAMAGVESAKLAQSQDALRQSFEDMKSLGKDVLGGFVSDLAHGKTASEALASALGKVTDKLLEMSLNSLFDGGKSAGILGLLFGGGRGAFPAAPGVGLFDKGGYTGPGGKYQPAGIVHAGEYVFDKESTSRIGVGTLEALQRAGMPGYAKGGAVQRQVWDFFRAKDLKPHQVAGIMGQVGAESGFNPAVDWGDNGNAWGLFQWNDRRHRMVKFVGKDWRSDPLGQLKFAWHEFMTTERRAFDALMKAKTVRQATLAAVAFERPRGFS